jgi:hypothetical protein
VFDELAQEIVQDRRTLLDPMDRFGLREDHVKVALPAQVQGRARLHAAQPARGG